MEEIDRWIFWAVGPVIQTQMIAVDVEETITVSDANGNWTLNDPQNELLNCP